MSNTLAITRVKPMDSDSPASIAALVTAIGVAIVAAVGSVITAIKNRRILDATAIETKKIDAQQAGMDRLERRSLAQDSRIDKLQLDLDAAHGRSIEQDRLIISLEKKIAQNETEISKLRDEARVRQMGYEEDVTRLQDENIALRNRVAELMADVAAKTRENATLTHENATLKGNA